MRAVTFCFRTEWRGRWRAWTVLALLVGAVAGTSLVMLAGSRRTESAHDRFLRGQRAFDVVIGVECGGAGASEPVHDASCAADVARLPAVQAATSIAVLPSLVLTADDNSVQPDGSDPCYSGPGAVHVVMDESRRMGTAINRNRYVAGRAASSTAADEVVISREIATRLHLGVGSELRIGLASVGGDQCNADPIAWQSPRRVTVVGVQLSPGQVRPPSGDYMQTVEVTPAFVRAAGDIPDRGDALIVRLRPGVSEETLHAQAEAAGYRTSLAFSQAEITGTVQRAIRPNQVSLLILAALTAFAGAVVLGQALVRHAAEESVDDALFAALGMRTRERIALAAMRGAVLGLLAATVGVVAAVAASPIMPIGLARDFEPAPGFSIDGVALGLGALAIVGFVTGVTVLATAYAAARAPHAMAVKPARLSGLAARSGFSPAAVSGTRFALERGSGSAVVPVVSSFTGLTIAVAAITGALTFGAGLAHLQSTPRLVGWNWDVVLAYPEESVPNVQSLEDARARVRAAFAAHNVTDAAAGTIWSPFPEGRDLQVGPDHQTVGGFIAFDGTARLGPSVINGRKPVAADEILLGPATIAELGLHIGDRVDVIGQEGTWDTAGRETSTRMRIVGTGLAPMTTALGRGAVITMAGLRHLNAHTREQAWFVRLGPDLDRDTVVEAFRSAFPEALRSKIEPFESEAVTETGLDLDQIGSVPPLFAVIMAVMAAAVLAHVLMVATRARRRDLAVLRALGFTRGQMRRTIAWQSTIYAVGSVVFGVPVGIALGRVIWHVYATTLGAVPEAVTPWHALFAMIAAAIAIAGVAAVVPALRAARTSPAVTLRAE